MPGEGSVERLAQSEASVIISGSKPPCCYDTDLKLIEFIPCVFFPECLRALLYFIC